MKTNSCESIKVSDWAQKVRSEGHKKKGGIVARKRSQAYEGQRLVSKGERSAQLSKPMSYFNRIYP